MDNERFGMRRFVYHSNIAQSDPTSDPSKAWEYYNMLRGIWKIIPKCVTEVMDIKLQDRNAILCSGDTDPCKLLEE